MQITGDVTSIIYKNEVNSYTIAEFETEEELTTIVRVFAICKCGRFFECDWKICRAQRIWKAI